MGKFGFLKQYGDTSTGVEVQSEAQDTRDYTLIEISKLRAFKDQPRRHFDPITLESLAANFRKVGILQPLLVRPIEGAFYEIIAGERRYRAAQLAELTAIPCSVRELSDGEAFEISLFENLQREDINPYEETDGVLRLLELKLSKERREVESLLIQIKNLEQRGKPETAFDNNVIITEEHNAVAQVFQDIGRFTCQSFVANRLPLLNLPDDIKDTLRQGRVQYTKALAISRIDNECERSELLERAVSDTLTLSEIKQQVKLIQQRSRSGFTKPVEPLDKRASQIEKSWAKRKAKYLERSETREAAKKIDRILKALQAKREELVTIFDELSSKEKDV